MNTEVTIPEQLADLLAKQASSEAAREVDTRPSNISIRGKKFRIGDENLGDTIKVVVGVAAYENTWYDRPYDPENVSPPACFAIALDDTGIEHHPDSPLPMVKGPCSACELAQWGSGVNGKGKACKNARRLSLLAYDDTANLDEAQMAMLKCPPTSLKAWASYAKSIALRYKRPTSTVITEVSFNDNNDYPQLEFNLVELLNAENINTVMDRAEELEAFALKPYNTSDYVNIFEESDGNTSNAKPVKKGKTS